MTKTMTDIVEQAATVEAAGLLPCPFCGGKAEVLTERQTLDGVTYEYLVVSCGSCYARTGRVGGGGTKKAKKNFAITGWNTRTPAFPRWRHLDEEKPGDKQQCVVWDEIDGYRLGFYSEDTGYFLGGGRSKLWLPLPASPSEREGEKGNDNGV